MLNEEDDEDKDEEAEENEEDEQQEGGEGKEEGDGEEEGEEGGLGVRVMDVSAILREYASHLMPHSFPFFWSRSLFFSTTLCNPLPRHPLTGEENMHASAHTLPARRCLGGW